MSRPTAVIVGASIGGVRTAQALRAANYHGRILLVGDEAVPPYDKPPLSKSFLAGTAGLTDIALLSHRQAAELDVEVRLGSRAVHLHLSRDEIELDNGECVGYDHLVIATGARARPSPWGQPDGVHVVRTFEDSRRLRADLTRGGRLVIVGGGFIGAEIAATARSLGNSVTIVDPSAVPMERALGQQVGERFIRLHERNGVGTLFGAGVEGITGRRGGFRVALTNGGVLDADYVVVGIGAVPNDDWLISSGLHIDDGVVCDKYLRVPNTTNVFAVGDVCRWQNPRHDRLTRVEHWTNAVEQAAIVGHNIAQPGALIACAPVEYVWSDQYDWKVRIVGQAGSTQDCLVEVIGEDPDTGRFAGLYSPDGRTLSGVVVVNWPRALIAGRKALAQKTPYAVLKEALEQLAGPRHINA
ncbi:NAD(P)/FAD-dependent oxidoreductase [Mycobacterium sp. pR1184]|uniref:NAD(P)/FAD-dependent oxidoreductase n=1 Tax=Mycobacterium sp. pR1184 TaxID=3238981 RepID=UPI00351AF6AE